MSILAALLAGIAAWLMVRPARRRPRRAATLPRHVAVRLASAGFGVVVAILIGGVLGVAMGVITALVTPMLVTRMESRTQRHRRESLERQAPAAADLLARGCAGGAFRDSP